jgi:hypothetical protein
MSGSHFEGHDSSSVSHGKDAGQGWPSDMMREMAVELPINSWIKRRALRLPRNGDLIQRVVTHSAVSVGLNAERGWPTCHDRATTGRSSGSLLIPPAMITGSAITGMPPLQPGDNLLCGRSGAASNLVR